MAFRGGVATEESLALRFLGFLLVGLPTSSTQTAEAAARPNLSLRDGCVRDPCPSGTEGAEGGLEPVLFDRTVSFRGSSDRGISGLRIPWPLGTATRQQVSEVGVDQAAADSEGGVGCRCGGWWSAGVRGPPQVLRASALMRPEGLGLNHEIVSEPPAVSQGLLCRD